MKFLLIFCLCLIFSCENSTMDTSNSQIIKKAIDNEFRNPNNVSRDKYRNPLETLTFFGLEKDMTVLEILPGRGWYTEILSNVLKDDGDYLVASFGNNHQNKYLKNIHIEFEKYFFEKENIFGKFKVVDFFNGDYLSVIDDKSLDMVLTFRNTHNWLKNEKASLIFKSFSRVLKKDGILGVVQHRSNTDAEKFKGEDGYVGEEFLIVLLENCGFELVDKAEINSNPFDIKDYPKGVWTLPPTLRDGKKQSYLEIGESDRMTLKFRKKNNASFANCHTY